MPTPAVHTDVRSFRRAFSLIGMLIALGCMLLLSVILMNSLNQAVTGAGNVKQGTVRSVQDQMYLNALSQSLHVGAGQSRGWFLVPSELDGSGDSAANTTAALYSAMVMANYSPPQQLVSANEYSLQVQIDTDYDHAMYDPMNGVYWDPSFTADLVTGSNVSFAHTPMFGERIERSWTTSSVMPIIGSRGPEGGVHDPGSMTYGRAGVWGGHILHADGAITFESSFTPTGLYYETPDGQMLPDNLYAAELGPDGADALLGFTKRIDPDGPVLQWD